MKFLSLNYPASILIITGFYLLYNNLNLLPGDPFLLYIGIVLTLLSYFKGLSLSYLIPGFTLIGAGIGQLMIIYSPLLNINNKFLLAVAVGLSQVAIFSVTRLTSRKIRNKGYYFYYWPLGIGLGLIILSIIYYLQLEIFFWKQIKIYWPIILPLLAISKEESVENDKKKIDLTD